VWGAQISYPGKIALCQTDQRSETLTRAPVIAQAACDDHRFVVSVLPRSSPCFRLIEAFT
jgi:hypothetical protein